MVYNKWVTDTFTGKDVGQMILSAFAILGVFSSKTVIPDIIPFGGVLITIFTIVILYIATTLFIAKKSYKKAAKTAYEHISYGIMVSFILTFFIGIIFGFKLYNIFNLYEVWFESEAIIAFNFGLMWAVVIDSLKD